jgi:hypothetical protein
MPTPEQSFEQSFQQSFREASEKAYNEALDAAEAECYIAEQRRYAAEMEREMKAMAEANDAWLKPERFPKIIEMLMDFISEDIKDWECGQEIEPDDCPRPFVPVEIVSIERCCMGYGNHSSMEGIAKCEDGISRKFVYKSDYFPGNYDNPPEGEENIEWSELEKVD